MIRGPAPTDEECEEAARFVSRTSADMVRLATLLRRVVQDRKELREQVALLKRGARCIECSGQVW
jgi:hypothetical protein